MTKPLFKIRTVTCFVTLHPSDFNQETVTGDASGESAADSKESVVTTPWERKLRAVVKAGRTVEEALVDAGYEVQTVRLATNPFPEWLLLLSNNNDCNNNNNDEKDKIDGMDTILNQRLSSIDTLLQTLKIDFCSLGPASVVSDIDICSKIILSSPRFSCSASLGNHGTERQGIMTGNEGNDDNLSSDGDKNNQDAATNVDLAKAA